MRNLVVSLHDVHPESFQSAREQVAFCEAHGVSRFSILLVPNYHRHGSFERSTGLVDWLRLRQGLGDEVVLHGFYHMGDSAHSMDRHWFWNRIYTQNEAEFLELDFAEASRRICDGIYRLRDAGLHPVGFVAPAWLANLEVYRAAFESGLLYSNTVNRIISAAGHSIRSRSLCYSGRAMWRRFASPAWNEALWKAIRGRKLARLSLHPPDLEIASFRQHISGILRDAAALQYKTTTYRDVIRGLAE